METWHWRLEPDSRYHAQPDIDGTDVLVLITRGTRAMTIDGRASRVAAWTTGHIVSLSGYQLANAARADAEFTRVHIPPATGRARYGQPPCEDQAIRQRCGG